MEEITLHAQLMAKCVDIGNYTTYVFKNLESTSYDTEYIMCVQFPNWDQFDIQIGDKGFVNVRYVQEGVSQWYDGDKMNFYKYTNIIFLKFIKEPNEIKNDILVD